MSTWTATPQQVERVIAAVLPHAANDGLLSLNFVQIEVGGHDLLAMATDRYSLGVCRVRLTDWDEHAKKVKKVTAAVHATDLKRLFSFLRPNRTKPALWTLTENALSVTIEDGESLRVRATQASDYPNWRKLFAEHAAREAKPGSVMAFTPRVVDHFHKSEKALGGDPKMRWYFTSPIKPVVVQIGDEFVGLLMPCRISNDAPELDLTAFGIESAEVTR